MLQVVQGDSPIDGGAGEVGTQAPETPLLLQYWQTVLRWKWVIGGIIATAVAAGMVITLLTTPVYTATARIEISREQQNVTSVEGLESREASRDDEFYQTQYSLLTARSLAERVVRSMRLSANDAFFAAHGVEPEGGILFGSADRPLSRDERQRRERLAVDLLLDHVAISPINRSRLTDVRYTSASPHLSADIANAWVQQFIAQSLDRRFASTSDARRFLETRLADLGQRLETSERAVVGYATQRNIVSLGRTIGPDGRSEGDRTLVAANLQGISDALIQATAQRIEAESRMRSTGTSREMLTSQALAGMRQRRAESAAERARLLVQFEPAYPAVQAIDQQIRNLDQSISREEARISNIRTREYQEAVAREQDLREQVAELTGDLTQQRQDSIQYNIYQREADTNRQLYDSLLQRYKEIGVAGVSLSNISVVDSARVPDSPSSPKIMINMALALIGGLGLAFLTVLGLEQIDEGLRDPTKTEQLLGLPLLGSVPDLADGEPALALADAKSELSEAYLSIQSSLAFSTEHGFPRALMLTSTRPAEGKSTSALGLATVLSRTGKKVLLIDADMRSPSIHELFGKSNAAGLSNYLSGDPDWRRLVQPTGQNGLMFMAAGQAPPNAAELLSGDRMSVLVRDLRESFDHIIIDSPPILGLADAPLLSRAVEGCAFVVEAEGVPVRGLRTALARLRQAQARMYGVIVSRFNQDRAGYGYGYGYGYGKFEEA